MAESLRNSLRTEVPDEPAVVSGEAEVYPLKSTG